MRAFTIPSALLLVMALAMGCAEDEMGPTEVSSQPQTAKVLAKFPSSWKIAFISDRDAVSPLTETALPSWSPASASEAVSFAC